MTRRFKRNALALTLGLLLGGAATYASATGYYHMVKPPVVVVKPPVVVAPPAPTPVPPPAAAPAQPAQQPASGGGSSSWLAKGGWAFIGVGVYFSAVVYSHWIWCAEDDRKPAKDRKCYRPLRDGMPS